MAPCFRGANWRVYGGYEYYITQYAEEIDYTWYEAREWCMNNGGDLASFHTTDEQTFVTDWVQ